MVQKYEVGEINMTITPTDFMSLTETRRITAAPSATENPMSRKGHITKVKRQ
jgi:hypothetical protein